jgi:hypothetical protein
MCWILPKTSVGNSYLWFWVIRTRPPDNKANRFNLPILLIKLLWVTLLLVGWIIWQVLQTWTFLLLISAVWWTFWQDWCYEGGFGWLGQVCFIHIAQFQWARWSGQVNPSSSMEWTKICERVRSILFKSLLCLHITSIWDTLLYVCLMIINIVWDKGSVYNYSRESEIRLGSNWTGKDIS